MNKLKESPNIRFLKLLVKLRPMYLPVLFINRLFSLLSPYLNLYMSAEIINEIAGDREVNRLMFLVIITISLNLLILTLNSCFWELRKRQDKKLEFSESEMFFDKMVAMDYANLENPEIQKLRTSIDSNKNINYHGPMRLLSSLEHMLDSIMEIFLSAGLSVSFITAVLSGSHIALNVALLLILFVFGGFSIFLTFYQTNKIKSKETVLTNAMYNIMRMGKGFYTYGAEKDVRLYRLDIPVMNHCREALKINNDGFAEYSKSSFKYSIPGKITEMCIDFFCYTSVVLCALDSLLPIGDIFKYVGYIKRLINAVKGLAQSVADFNVNTGYVAVYMKFFDIKNAMSDGESLISGETGDATIEFKNVSFKYPEALEYALQGLNLKIRKGDRLAVVGMNGSGKTTMIKLLCRLYDPSEGEVLFNGTNIKNFSYKEYLDLFSVVFQDFKLFSFPIAQNISASADYDREKVLICLKKSGFEKRLSEMEKGVDTPLYKNFYEDGIAISGGEAQKLALARALYKDAPVIILDEPTAALDPIAEYEVYSAFNSIIGAKTAIYISHRLSSCRFCDEIIVFDKGRMVQKGTHYDLLEDINGKYYELWNAQAVYYTT